MTVDKLREILEYFPGNVEIIIKDRYGDDVETLNLKIISKIEDEVIKKYIRFDWK